VYRAQDTPSKEKPLQNGASANPSAAAHCEIQSPSDDAGDVVKEDSLANEALQNT
jgi:hypothetical protein